MSTVIMTLLKTVFNLYISETKLYEVQTTNKSSSNSIQLVRAQIFALYYNIVRMYISRSLAEMFFNMLRLDNIKMLKRETCYRTCMPRKQG